MILVGRYRSPYARRVAISMQVLGIKYEHQPVKPWPSNQELLTLNPMGRVPILILDDGTVLIESAYMIEYLDHRVGPERSLTPVLGDERLIVQNIAFLAMGILEKVITANHERYRRPDGYREVAWIKRCEMQVVGGLSMLERFIKPHPWLAGEKFTQADIMTGILCDHIGLTCPQLLEKLECPKLDTVLRACREHPAFINTVPEF